MYLCLCVCVVHTVHATLSVIRVVEDVTEIRYVHTQSHYHIKICSHAYTHTHTHTIMSLPHVLRYAVSPAIVTAVCPEITACGLHGTVSGENSQPSFHRKSDGS
jgi:hypothetical protein